MVLQKAHETDSRTLSDGTHMVWQWQDDDLTWKNFENSDAVNAANSTQTSRLGKQRRIRRSVEQWLWQWQSGGAWQAYSGEACDKLEQAYQSNKPTCIVDTTWGDYEVDFKNWTQQLCNGGVTSDRRQRNVRRVMRDQIAAGSTSSDSRYQERACDSCKHTKLSGRLGDRGTEFEKRWFCKDCWDSWEKAGGDPQKFEYTEKLKHAEKIGPSKHRLDECIDYGVNRRIKDFCRSVLEASTKHRGWVHEFIHKKLGPQPCAAQLFSRIVDALGQDCSALDEALLSWSSAVVTNEQDEMIKPLTQRYGEYDWIRQDNSFDSRKKRLNAALTTIVVASLMKVSSEWLGRTCFVRADEDIPTQPSIQPVLLHSLKAVFEEFLDTAHQRSRIALVSAASAYHVGGGFLTGGRHALEESACMQSTLFFSLHKSKHLAKECNLRGRYSRSMHIPEDGIALAPDVQIFRDGSVAGYPWREDLRTVPAVLSVAMPNRNPAVHDTPYEFDCDQDYKAKLMSKWIAVLKGAAKVQADAIVIPDVGCGVFKNDPIEVGNALGHALRQHSGRLEQVTICGSKEFFDSVNNSFYSKYAERLAEKTRVSSM